MVYGVRRGKLLPTPLATWYHILPGRRKGGGGRIARPRPTCRQRRSYRRHQSSPWGWGCRLPARSPARRGEQNVSTKTMPPKAFVLLFKSMIAQSALTRCVGMDNDVLRDWSGAVLPPNANSQAVMHVYTHSGTVFYSSRRDKRASIQCALENNDLPPRPHLLLETAAISRLR